MSSLMVPVTLRKFKEFMTKGRYSVQGDYVDVQIEASVQPYGSIDVNLTVQGSEPKQHRSVYVSGVVDIEVGDIIIDGHRNKYRIVSIDQTWKHYANYQKATAEVIYGDKD